MEMKIEMSPNPAGAAGAPAADSGMKTVQDSVIDAVIDASAESDASAPDRASWRDRSGQGDSLTPEFLVPVLNYMRVSNVCRQQTRRCIEVCFQIARDCKPCAADAECSKALTRVCGERIGTCQNP
jgi:hypothetical protein